MRDMKMSLHKNKQPSASLRAHCLLLVLWLAVSCQASVEHHNLQEGCRRLDAAISYSGSTYLFMGADYVKVVGEGEEPEVKSKDEGWGGLGRIDAAFIWAEDGYPYFVEGSNYYYYSAWRARSYGPYPNSDWDDRLNMAKGVDAAGILGESSYLFKCCEFVVYEKNQEGGVYKDRASLQELGLPCDLHAAVSLDKDSLALVKYDQLWLMTANGTVSGPMDANSVLNLHPFSLCAEEEDEGDVREVEEIKVDEDDFSDGFEEDFDF